MTLLRFKPDATEDELRCAIVEAGRIAYERHLLTSNDGNLSVRLDDERILITPSGLCKGRLAPDDLLIMDMQGTIVRPAADPRLKSTTETPMHLEVYRHRPKVRAVIHAHPPYAIALTVAGRPLRLDVLPEVMLGLGEVPTTAYATPSSEEDAFAIRDLIDNHEAILLRQHGSLTVGIHLDEAVIHLERLELAAMVLVLAEAMGQINTLSPEAMTKLRAMRANFVSLSR